jgi:chromatin segregation and condensation protein Rec8/ScpA/Scc1 (kleisin family)
LVEALRIQLILKGVITENDWQEIGEKINIDFIEDNYFAELKEFEIMKERLDMASQMEDLVGKYVSTKYLRQSILKQSDEDIERLDKEIEDEGSDEPNEDDLDL